MKKCVVLILLALSFAGDAQIITTFAGGGTGGLGDGGPATVALLSNPIGGVFDKYGNYYCAQAIGGNRVRKISTTGIITTIAGTGMSGFSGDGGPATAAKLSNPCAVKLDIVGNIYIVDANNMRIRKVDAITGIITTVAGSSSTGGFGGDNRPATAAMLNVPGDLCFDKFGNLYIGDATNHRVRKINTSGIITTIAGTGIAGSTGDGGPATAANIRFPGGIAIDNTGNLYIAGLDYRVRKITTSGIITTIAGNGVYTYIGDEIPATNAQIDPIKLVVNNLGQLIIADYRNYRVFKVDNAGIIHTIVGNGVAGFSGDGGLATAAALNYPSGVAFDTCGNLYIPEAGNNRIRKVDFNPYCWPAGVPENTTANNISIYPNPANDVLHIDGVKKEQAYKLYSIIGAVMQQGSLQQGINNIPIQSLPAGMYMVEVSNSAGTPPSPSNGYGGQGRTITKIIKQ